MSLLTTGITSLALATAEVVEISTEKLTQLERFAGFGRFALLALIIAIVIIALRFYVNAIVAAEVRKAAKSKMRHIAESVAESAIEDYCTYGTICDAIEKEIKASCNYGHIYDLVNHGSVSNPCPIDIEVNLNSQLFNHRMRKNPMTLAFVEYSCQNIQ